jgi:hypothetical protein
VEMDGACFVVGEEECMHDFGGETWRKESTWWRVGGRVILKCLSRLGGCELESSVSGYGQVVGCCEHVMNLWDLLSAGSALTSCGAVHFHGLWWLVCSMPKTPKWALSS